MPRVIPEGSDDDTAVCGGCRGIGSHRRHCPRHPDYHPWKRLADMAESVGDQVGEPSLANRAWALAGAIRDAIPSHPYRRREVVHDQDCGVPTGRTWACACNERGGFPMQGGRE